MFVTSTILQVVFALIKVSGSFLLTTAALTVTYLSYDYDLRSLLPSLTPAAIINAELLAKLRSVMSGRVVLVVSLVFLSHVVEFLPTLLTKATYTVTQQAAPAYVEAVGMITGAWQSVGSVPLIHVSDYLQPASPYASLFAGIQLDNNAMTSVVAYNESGTSYYKLGFNDTTRCLSRSGYDDGYACEQDVTQYVDDNLILEATPGDIFYAVSNDSSVFPANVVLENSPYVSKLQPAQPDFELAISASETHPYSWVRDQTGYQTLDNGTLYWNMHEIGVKVDVSDFKALDIKRYVNMSSSLRDCAAQAKIYPVNTTLMPSGLFLFTSHGYAVDDEFCVVTVYQTHTSAYDVAFVIMTSVKPIVAASGPRFVVGAQAVSNQVLPASAGWFSTTNSDGYDGNIGVMNSDIMTFYQDVLPAAPGTIARSCDMQEGSDCLEALTMLAQYKGGSLVVPTYAVALVNKLYMPEWFLALLGALVVAAAAIFVYNITRKEQAWFAQIRDVILNTTLPGQDTCNSATVNKGVLTITYDSVKSHVFLVADGHKVTAESEDCSSERMLPDKEYKGLRPVVAVEQPLWEDLDLSEARAILLLAVESDRSSR